MNTYGSKINVGTNSDGTPITHCPHEYCDTLKNVYLEDFLYSEEYLDYQKRSGNAGLKYSKFREGAKMCPCIQVKKVFVTSVLKKL
jgi:hypothetical protein